MSVTFRTYQPEPLFGEDYRRVRSFLLQLDNHSYPFGRWDWMITHRYLDKSSLPRIGLWESGGEIVGVVTNDCVLGEAFLLANTGYRHLSEEMLLYAKEAFAKEGKFRVFISDSDTVLQDVAARNGFFPTQNKEEDAVYLIDVNRIHYTLPEGFHITSMKETYDLFKYGEVLWKGFNHEASGEGPFIFREEERPDWELEFKRPNVNLDIKIAVVAPNGAFASYCGMWQDDASPRVLVEPVATDPAYRGMGLGRAAVLEGIYRCGLLGAKQAYVGSSQQFYYNIGFRPFATGTWWSRKES